MNLLYFIIFFLFGTIMGSIYTVIGYRLPKEDKRLFDKFHCDKCDHKLKLFELIPIFSYLYLNGNCSYCHKRIDTKNILMEIFTGLLFMISYYTFGFSYELLIALGVVSLLVIVTVSDMTYLIIPDEVLIFFSIYFIIIQYFRLGLYEVFKHIFIGLFLFFLMYTVMLIGNKLFKRESLGGGDIKMMFLFGLVLDLFLGTLTIFVGSVLALPFSLILLYTNKEKVIPFGPFLLLALTFIYFIQIKTSTIIYWFGF